jgi:hypothetical protein
VLLQLQLSKLLLKKNKQLQFKQLKPNKLPKLKHLLKLVEEFSLLPWLRSWLNQVVLISQLFQVLVLTAE